MREAVASGATREMAPPQCWKPTVVARSGCGSSPFTTTSMSCGGIFFTKPVLAYEPMARFPSRSPDRLQGHVKSIGQ